MSLPDDPTADGPIDVYDSALVGNCQSCFLVHRSGAVIWGCLPTFASPAVFARMLDPKGGMLALSPVNAEVKEQRYLPLTNVLVTSFEGEDAAWDVIDWMPRYYEGSRVVHPPVLHRLVKVRRGHPELRLRFDPQPSFGLGETRQLHLGDALLVEHEAHRFYLQSNLPLARLVRPDTVTLRSDVCLTFAYGEPIDNYSLQEVRADLQRTRRYWERWSQHCHLPLEFQNPILRSALTLKMLTFEDTGAVVAAATTSLPEDRGGDRNWDYRFCWLRDSFFVVRALARLAQFEEESRYLSFIEQLPLQPGRLQPVYGIDGEATLLEQQLEHLAGAFNSRPVRTGNQAHEHIQNDVYGELMLSLVPVFFDVRFRSTAHREMLWELVERLARDVQEVWRSKDAGIWEYRDQPDHYVFSKLMCWVALDRASLVARSTGHDDEADEWRAEAQVIREEIEAKAWNEELGAFAGTYGGSTLDAANLLIGHTGFLHPKDPRYVSTVRAVERELVTDGLCFRYKHADDFGKPESTFSICTFWYVDALRLIGERERAREVYEKLLARSNHVGLFGEGLHPEQGYMTGNFPQAYTHVAIINSGMMLSKRWGDLGARDFGAEDSDHGEE